LAIERGHAPADPQAPLSSPLDVARPVQQTTVIESSGGAAFRPEFASLGSRLAGWLIDTLVMLVLMAPGVVIAIVGSGVVVLIGVLLAVAGFVGAAVWYARSVAATDQWFGNRMMSTRVVNVVNGSHLDKASAGTRFVIRQLISTIFFIGFLVALGNSQRRAFHDQIAESVVVRPPRATWSIDDE
jgi:hypothetical protein